MFNFLKKNPEKWTRSKLLAKMAEDLEGTGFVSDKGKRLVRRGEFPMTITFYQHQYADDRTLAFDCPVVLGVGGDPEDLPWLPYSLNDLWRLFHSERTYQVAIPKYEPWEFSRMHEDFAGPFRELFMLWSTPSRAIETLISEEGFELGDLGKFSFWEGDFTQVASLLSAADIAIAYNQKQWAAKLHGYLEAHDTSNEAISNRLNGLRALQESK